MAIADAATYEAKGPPRIPVELQDRYESIIAAIGSPRAAASTTRSFQSQERR